MLMQKWDELEAEIIFGNNRKRKILRNTACGESNGHFNYQFLLNKLNYISLITFIIVTSKEHDLLDCPTCSNCPIRC